MQNDRTMNVVTAAVTATATVILIAGAIVATTSRQTLANTEMAKTTGLPCAKRHTAASALNQYGKKYKASIQK